MARPYRNTANRRELVHIRAVTEFTRPRLYKAEASVAIGRNRRATWRLLPIFVEPDFDREVHAPKGRRLLAKTALALFRHLRSDASEPIATRLQRRAS